LFFSIRRKKKPNGESRKRWATRRPCTWPPVPRHRQIIEANQLSFNFC
jgi:hypothetical protein